MWIGCICCENIQSDFAARIIALIAPIRPVLHQVLCGNVTVPNARKHYETHQKMCLGSNGEDHVCSLWRIAMWLRCKNFALIAPVRPILHRVLCSNEMVLGARKQYEMYQNMSLGSNGVERVHSLRKITTQVRCTNFCTNCTSFGRFAPSSVQHELLH